MANETIRSRAGFCRQEQEYPPDLYEHPDPARHQVRPPGHPRRAVPVPDPDEALHEVGVLGPYVVRAVLHAKQVSRGGLGLARRRRTAEAELAPAHDREPARDPDEVPDRVERDLRVVGASLYAEVPVGPFFVQNVSRERR